MVNEKQLAEKIALDYQQTSLSKVEKLKMLNKKVYKPVRIFAYVFGVLSALILGLGMSMAMKVIFDSMIIGVLIGTVGIALCLVNYPIYKKVLALRKKKYSSQILSLSEEILHA